ncbi:MAG: glucose-6-phosphate isomerase family protein [Candidatus Syntropharchaeia archaeon]
MLQGKNPDVRRLYDMKEVLYDKEFLRRSENIDLYYMYRDLALTEEDKKNILSRGLRYDITIIPPRKLGKEWVKTAGHYHPSIPGSEMTYPEVYEVLEGKGHYLLQKMEKGEITDVILVEAKKGDKVIIPPNYGHITINPSEEMLKMANWVSRDFSSIYEPIRKKGGGAYFETIDGEFIKNENYSKLPDIRFSPPSNHPELGKEMYYLIRENPDLLNFLKRPWDFDFLFEWIRKNF